MQEPHVPRPDEKASPVVALIGTGRWGSNHLRVLRSLGLDLFVVDRDPGRLKLASELGVGDDRLATNHLDVIGSVDAAVVATPAQTHFEISRRFLDAGKDVLVEKPMALTSREALDLIHLSEARGCILQAGHIFRYDEASRWLHHAVLDRTFGSLRMLRGSFSGFKRPRPDGGVMVSDGVHFIDLFNYIIGVPPSRVTAKLSDFMGRGMDDALLLSLEYETSDGPVWALVEANYFVPGKWREIIVVGEELTAVCDFNIAQYKLKTYENRHSKTDDGVEALEGSVSQLEFPPAENLLIELQAFLHSVRTRERPLADGRSAYEVARVLEAAVESSATGRTVTIG